MSLDETKKEEVSRSMGARIEKIPAFGSADRDAKVRQAIVWLFDVAKNALIVGAVFYAAKSTASFALLIFALILGGALFLHIHMTLIFLDLHIFPDKGRKGLGYWANVAVSTIIFGGLFGLVIEVFRVLSVYSPAVPK